MACILPKQNKIDIYGLIPTREKLSSQPLQCNSETKVKYRKIPAISPGLIQLHNGFWGYKERTCIRGGEGKGEIIIVVKQKSFEES